MILYMLADYLFLTTFYIAFAFILLSLIQTTHFKLLNAIAKSSADLKLPKENELSAYRFHSDMFASGIERIILVRLHAYSNPGLVTIK